MLNYPCMDLKAAIAECSQDLNDAHNRLKDDLFGSMHDVLLNEGYNGCCAKSKLYKKLKTAPTIKETKVNILHFLQRNQARHPVKMMNGYDFIQGVGTLTNQQFLLFVLKSFYTQRHLQISVAVIFNETDIDHVIISNHWKTYTTTKNYFEIESVVRLIKYGQLDNDLGYDQIKTWIHLKDEYSSLMTLRENTIICNFIIFIFIVLGIIAINWIISRYV